MCSPWWRTPTTGSPNKPPASNWSRPRPRRASRIGPQPPPALKGDGSVSASDEEQAQTRAQQTKAAAEAEGRRLELARNRLKYTVLRASRAGVVTQVRAEVGQVLAEGQPVVSIATQGEPEIVVDVPEEHFASFKKSQYKASLATAPGETFEVGLRELSLQAASQTRTYRARLKPVAPRPLPLGASATVLVERTTAETPMAAIPSSAITQANGQPAVWVVRRAAGEPGGTVELTSVAVHAYRNDAVLISGLPAGDLVVTAGVQKMAPGLRVALPETRRASQAAEAGRAMKSFNLTEWALGHRAIVVLPHPRHRHRRNVEFHPARPARGSPSSPCRR